MPRYTNLQSHVHRALLDGVSPAMEEYLLGKNWEREDIKKLAFSLTFFDKALRSKTKEEHESNLQNLVSTLTMHTGISEIMPHMSPLFKDPDIKSFLEDESSVEQVAKEAFGSYEYKNFKYKASKPKVPIWDLDGIDSKVNHICPSGVIVRFQGQISYLFPKSYRQVQMFFGDPSDYKKSRRTEIRDLKIKRGNDEFSIWDKITVHSVAMIPRTDGNDYTYSDRIAYVLLKFEKDQDVEKELRKVGGEGNLKIATKTNLSRYVPQSLWEEKFKNDIETAKKKFGEMNKKILNNENEETKKKSRDALKKLTGYYKALQGIPEIDGVEPQETRARVASRDSNRTISENADEDDRMSISSEEL